ncbi:MAG: hypothetical protein IBX51_05815 [Marinobacter sp.]|nr:methyltransferase [Marinobacter sp.]MBE0485638.1 hypothetical protein [Marinobacter sp.]
MWAVSRVLPSGYFTFPGRILLCVVVLIAGAVIALLGVLAFRRAGTTVDPRTPDQATSLVVNGVYRHTRNPMRDMGWRLPRESRCSISPSNR